MKIRVKGSQLGGHTTQTFVDKEQEKMLELEECDLVSNKKGEKWNIRAKSTADQLAKKLLKCILVLGNLCNKRSETASSQQQYNPPSGIA